MTMYNNKELNESDHHNEAYLKEKMHIIKIVEVSPKAD